jgi:hypothetical protein
MRGKISVFNTVKDTIKTPAPGHSIQNCDLSLYWSHPGIHTIVISPSFAEYVLDMNGF